MADSRIGILIQQSKAGSGIKDTISDLQGLDSAAGSLSQGLAGIAVAGGIAGIVALGSAAVSATAELARASAQAGDMRAVFNDMATNAGESGEQMLSSMQKASGGMVSNAALVGNANRAMLLEVADSSEEMAELLDVARVRGQAMGASLEESFGDVVTGIGRLSPMILDNLGIAVDLQTVYDGYAASLGRTATSLTEAEKKQALLNKVIADTQPLINSSVAAGQDMMAPFERADAAIANMKQSLGELFGPAVAVVAESIAKAAGAAAEGLSAIGENMNIASVEAEISSLSAVMDKMREGITRLEADKGTPFFDSESLGRALVDLNEMESRMSQLKEMRVGLTGSDTQAIELAGVALGGLVTNADLAKDSLQDLSRGGGMLSDALRDTFLATQDTERGAGMLSDTLRDGAAATRELAGTLASSPASFAMFAAAAVAAGADVSELIGLIDQASGALNQLQGARDSAVRGLASNLARQVEEGLISKEQAASLFDTGVDTAESSMQQYAQSMAEGSKSTDDLILEQELLFQQVDDGSQAIDEADAAAKRYARTLGGDATKAARDAERAFGDLKSKVSSVLSDALSDTAGVNPDDILGNLGIREDAIAENARRLADVAANGFKDQDWLGEFAAEVPDIFKELQEAGDPRAAAAAMLKEFQQGFRPELLDKDLLKQTVKDMIMGDQAKEQLATELAQELAGELGTSIPDALAAAREAVGARGGAAEDGGGSEIGAQFAEGISSAGTTALAKLNEILRNEENLKQVEASGEKAGEKWGLGFLRMVNENVPQQLIDLLANLVTPLVQGNLKQQQSLTGASG